jgi:hypothetical protein
LRSRSTNTMKTQTAVSPAVPTSATRQVGTNRPGAP